MAKSQVSQIMTPAEAGKYLGITGRGAVRLARLGRLPARKVGREWRFSRVQLDAWILGVPQLHQARPGAWTKTVIEER